MSGVVRFRDESPLDFLEEEDNDVIEIIPSDDSSCDSSDDTDSFFKDLQRRIRKRKLPRTILDDRKKKKTGPHNVSSLLDLAASATARRYSLEELENSDTHMDQLLLKKVSRWSFPYDENQVKCCARLCIKTEEEWRRADYMCRKGRIKDVRQVGLMLSAVVGKPNTSDMSKVTLTFEKQTITSTKCSICPNKLWCCHIISVALYRMRNADSVPVYPPMMEMLWDMSRDQLQKLLQCAVQNEPEVLLPVFKHIDALKDRKSDLYKQSGAPDPTFSLDASVDRTWELSLMKLKDDMKNMNGIYDYPGTCDFIKKAASAFHRKYFQRVPELINQGHIEQAGKVLMIIAASLLSALPSEEEECLWEAFLDVERMFTCFIISYNGPVRQEIITIAMEINKRCEDIRDGMEFSKPSKWSRVAAIRLDACLSDLRHRKEPPPGFLQASASAPFYQPVCASLIDVMPKALRDLLSGTILPLTTTYDEPLPIMLLRFDSLVLYGKDQLDGGQYRLGVVILRKLLLMSAHLSILGRNSPGLAVSRSLEDDDFLPTKAKRTRWEDGILHGEAPLPTEQLTNCLLYVCFLLVKGSYLKTVPHDDPIVLIVIDAMYRGIELGRFRPVSPSIEDDALEYEEFQWLHEMENELKSCYIYSKARTAQIDTCYVDALMQYGPCFYGDNMAVGLLSLLVYAVDGIKEKDKALMKVCVEAVCFSTSPFKGEDPEIFLGIHEEDWSVVLCTAYKVFFEKDNVDLAEKMLDHFSNLKDVHFANIAFDAFASHVFNDRWGKDDLDISSYPIRFVLALVMQSVVRSWKLVEAKRKDMADMLEMLSLQEPGDVTYYLLKHWGEVCMFFDELETKKFLTIMVEYTKDKTEWELETHFTMILNHVARKDLTHHQQSCYIHKLFKTETYRIEALDKLKWNYKSYTPSALLWIAKFRHEMIGSPCLPHCIFCHNVFHILQLAFYKIREKMRFHGTSALKEYSDTIKWFFKVIAERGSEAVAKGNQFDVFLREVGETFDKTPMFIVTFFDSIAISEPLRRKARVRMGTKLMTYLQRALLSEAEVANSTQEYDVVLDKLCDARTSCMRHGICDSLLDFRLKVTDPIRLQCIMKRDFMPYMEEYYHVLLLPTCM